MTAAKQHTQLFLAARGCLRNGQRAHTCEVEANIAAAVWLAGGRAGWAALDDFVHHTVPPPALLPVCQAPRCIALRPHAHRHAYDSQGQRQPSRRLLAVQNPAAKCVQVAKGWGTQAMRQLTRQGTFARRVQRHRRWCQQHQHFTAAGLNTMAQLPRAIRDAVDNCKMGLCRCCMHIRAAIELCRHPPTTPPAPQECPLACGRRRLLIDCPRSSGRLHRCRGACTKKPRGRFGHSPQCSDGAQVPPAAPDGQRRPHPPEPPAFHLGSGKKREAQPGPGGSTAPAAADTKTARRASASPRHGSRGDLDMLGPARKPHCAE